MPKSKILPKYPAAGAAYSRYTHLKTKALDERHTRRRKRLTERQYFFGLFDNTTITWVFTQKEVTKNQNK